MSEQDLAQRPGPNDLLFDSELKSGLGAPEGAPTASQRSEVVPRRLQP